MVKIDKKWCYFHLKWCYLHLRWCYLHLRWCYLRRWLGCSSQPKILRKIQKNLRGYIPAIPRFLHVWSYHTQRAFPKHFVGRVLLQIIICCEKSLNPPLAPSVPPSSIYFMSNIPGREDIESVSSSADISKYWLSCKIR